jgi:hypothetical protein
MGIPKNGWFIMENPIKWMIWGYPHDLGSLHMCGIVEGVSFSCEVVLCVSCEVVRKKHKLSLSILGTSPIKVTAQFFCWIHLFNISGPPLGMIPPMLHLLQTMYDILTVRARCTLSESLSNALFKSHEIPRL